MEPISSGQVRLLSDGCIVGSLLAFCLLLAFPVASQSITVTFTSSVAKGGNLHLAVYDSDRGFVSREEVLSLVEPTNGEPVSLEVSLPEAGEYVLAAFHDLNGNGELDTNLFGAPTEPYGFGRRAPSKWREPLFAEIATPITGPASGVHIELKKWKEY